MHFQYRARTLQGELEGGRIEAPTREIALEMLRKRNLIVTYLEEVTKPEEREGIVIGARVKMQDLIFLFQQLGLLIGAGVSIPEALRSIAQQTTNKFFRKILHDISVDVEAGSYLSKAFSNYPRIFSTFIVNMIRTGELAGNLRKVVEYLADHFQREAIVKSKVKGSLFYPLFVIGMAVIVVIVMFTFVLPQMSRLLSELGGEVTLPLPTRVLLKVGEFFGKYGVVFLLLVLGVGIFLWYFTQRGKGKEIKDRIIIKIPIFGSIFTKIYLSTLAENLSTLLRGGIPIAQALETVGRVIDHVEFSRVLFTARDDVRKGKSLTSSFGRSPLIPDAFVQIISAGEKSGKLGEVLSEIATFYEREVETTVDNLTNLLTPLMIVAIGVGVAFVAIAVIMPIYNMVAQFK